MTPKFTQRHYEFLAKFFARELFISEENTTQNGAVREMTIAGLARLLATELERDNAKFSRKRFLDAVGTL
jgi:hypothetical protein